MEKKEHLSGTRENLFQRRNEKLETLIYMKKSEKMKRLKTVKFSSFSCVPFLLLSYWMRDNDYSPKPRPIQSLSFSSGTWLPEDGTHGQTSETYFYQSEERSSNLLVFLFSHIAFIFLKCAYCTLDSGYV